MSEPSYVERQFNQINAELLNVRQQLGTITAILERGGEDRREIGNALGQFRDDIQELNGLGPLVKEALDKINTNSTAMKVESARVDGLLRDANGKIDAIEKWRQRRIGALSVIGAAGGIVVLLGQLGLEWLRGGRTHP